MSCARCAGEDAEAAWSAMTSNRLAHLIDESHFSVQVTACACGQRHAVVFTERIDWRGGEDDQLWLAVAIAPDEAAALEAAGEAALPAALTQMASGRRFLVRAFPTGGALGCWWRDAGFGIGPHD